MNMFKDSKGKTIKEYIAAVPDDRRETIKAVDKLIRETVPKLKPHFASNMLGYGSFEYTDYKKQQRNWPVVALANQKQYISVYVCAMDGKTYLAEKYQKELGKVSVGKSCIRFKKLEDLHLPTLKKVLKEAAKNPGLDYA